jgi:hypothetical protein
VLQTESPESLEVICDHGYINKSQLECSHFVPSIWARIPVVSGPPTKYLVSGSATTSHGTPWRKKPMVVVGYPYDGFHGLHRTCRFGI